MIDNLKEIAACGLATQDSSRRVIRYGPAVTAGRSSSITPTKFLRTIRYIENNPLPLGLPIQHWPFITPYDNWPLHAGHSPNSPYARRLRAAGLYPSS